MGGLFCGIDIGTTNLKVALVDGDEARTLRVESVETPRVHDDLGPVTDAAALLAAIEELIVRGWRAVGRGRPLAAIAAAGIGEDGVALDGDLRPTGHALPWFDMRATAEAVELQAGNAHDEEAGIAIDPTRTAAKWLWLKRHRPAELAGARHWVALTDYPAVAWSGMPFMSETLAVRTACYSLVTRRFIPELLSACGAPPLPPVHAAGTAIGPVRGGALVEAGAADQNTLVVAGGHDHPVAAAVIRAQGAQRRVDSLGTANLIYAEAAEGRLAGRSPLLAFGTPVKGGNGLACLGVFAFAAALDGFGIERASLARTLALASLPQPASGDIPVAGGRPAGPVSDTAALEACAFHARAMLDAARLAGAEDGPIFATGGWARSRALVELRASVFGETVHTVDEEELTAFGAALLACDGTGRSFADRLALGGRAIEPKPGLATRYAELYARWPGRQQQSAASAAGEGS